MGHRALIARERPGGTFDVYGTQWGGDDLAAGQKYAAADPSAVPGVDPEPVARGLGRREVYARVDWLTYEAVYVVPTEGEVEAYLAVSLRIEPGTPGEATAAGPGILVAPSADDPAGDRLRARIEGARAALRELVERGAVDAGSASASLVAVARSWAEEVIAPD